MSKPLVAGFFPCLLLCMKLCAVEHSRVKPAACELWTGLPTRVSPGSVCLGGPIGRRWTKGKHGCTWGHGSCPPLRCGDYTLQRRGNLLSKGNNCTTLHNFAYGSQIRVPKSLLSQTSPHKSPRSPKGFAQTVQVLAAGERLY